MNSQEARQLFVDVFAFEPDTTSEKGLNEFNRLLSELSDENYDNELIHRCLFEIAKTFNPNDKFGICLINMWVVELEPLIFSEVETETLMAKYVMNLDLSKRSALKDAAYMIDVFKSGLASHPIVRIQISDLLNRISASDIIEIGEKVLENSISGFKQGYERVLSHLYQMGLFTMRPEVIHEAIREYAKIDDWYSYCGIDFVSAIVPYISPDLIEPEYAEPLLDKAIELDDRLKVMYLAAPGYLPYDSELFAKAYLWIKDKASKEFDEGMPGTAFENLAYLDNLLITYDIPLPANSPNIDPGLPGH